MKPQTRSSCLRMVKHWITKAYAGSSVPTRSLSSLIGSLSSLRRQLPRAGLYLRALHTNSTAGVRSAGWNGSVTLSRKVASELLWWCRNIGFNTPYDFAYRPPQATLTTDAAGEGFGAWLQHIHQSWTTSGFFLPQDSLSSSNQRETAAVLRALIEFLPTLQANKINSILIQSDNMSTVCNLARQAAAITLLKMTRAIFSILTKADIRIVVKHIPGVDNTLADSLSRLSQAGDYALRPEIYSSAVASLHVTPTVDCFATNQNRKCDRFFAPAHDQWGLGAAAIDGLLQPWSSETLPYLHPPISLIPKVLLKIRQERISAVMVVPFWPTHSWWSSLTPLMRSQINLGPSDKVLLKGPSMDPKLHKLPPGDILICFLYSVPSIPSPTD